MDSKVLRKQIANQLKHYTSPGENLPAGQYTIRITEKQSDTVHLSELISAAIESLFHDLESCHIDDFDVTAILSCSFDEIMIDSKFPNKIIFDQCSGIKVSVQESEYFSGYDYQLLEVTFNECLIKNISIDSMAKIVQIRNLESDSLNISMPEKSDFRAENISIDGKFKDLYFSHVSCNLLSFQLEHSTDEKCQTRLDSVDVRQIDALLACPGRFELYDSKVGEVKLNARAELGLDFGNSEIESLKLYIYYSDILSFNISYISKLKLLDLVGTPYSNTELRIPHFSIQNVYFGRDFVGNIVGFEIENGLNFENFINRGELVFSSVDLLSGSLNIKQSLFGKVTFFNCKVPNRLVFQESNIEEMVVFGQIVPFDIESDSNLDVRKILVNKLLALKQLKTAASKAGDKELSGYYRAMELNSRGSLITWRDTPEKIAILLNRTNSHGQNWIKPAFIGLAGVGPLMYALFVCSLGFKFEFSLVGWQNFMAICSHYIEFIVPGYVAPTKNKWQFLNQLPNIGNLTFDSLPLFSKLLVYATDTVIFPYLIVQTISAFRRHLSRE